MFGGGQKAASGGIQGDVLATDNNTVGMGDAGIKSAIQGSNVPNPDEAVPSFVSGAMAKAGKGLLEGTLQSGTFFFFSSRRRHTRFDCDWSSDVCSSDLIGGGGFIVYRDTTGRVRALDYREMAPGRATRDMYVDATGNPTKRSVTGHLAAGVRSEERRVGKECRSRWSANA